MRHGYWIGNLMNCQRQMVDSATHWESANLLNTWILMFDYCYCNITKKNKQLDRHCLIFMLIKLTTSLSKKFHSLDTKTTSKIPLLCSPFHELKERLFVLHFYHCGLNRSPYSFLLRHFGQVIYENWCVSLA